MFRPLANDPRNALNAICPYFTMFPLEYPLRVLRRHTRASPVVMDPFCGRGTTLFAARMLGLLARGIDTSPVAVAIAQAKLCRVSPAAVVALARNLLDTVRRPRVPSTEFFRCAFHAETLREICAIREGLLSDGASSEAGVILCAAMLGALHGPTARSLERQAYFSNQMPRTFATKPAYSVGFWRAKRLKAPKVDVVAVLQRKLERIEPSSVTPRQDFRRVQLGDSTRLRSLPPASRDFSIVVTSPPYYGMRTYVEDQWLRTWFLGGPSSPCYGNAAQLEHTGKAVFAESLGAVWRNMASSKSAELRVYVRFGALPSVRADARELIRDSLEASGVDWRMKSIRPAASASAGKRQAVHMAAESEAVVEYDFCFARS